MAAALGVARAARFRQFDSTYAPSITGQGGTWTGKIALEEHFNLRSSNPQYVKPTTMKEISRRLLDVTTERLAEMDAVGIGYMLHNFYVTTAGNFHTQTARRLIPGLPERTGRPAAARV